MLDAEAPPTATDLERLEAMTACAFELGQAAAAIAKATPQNDTQGFLAASTEFRHCFFAVRMGIRLSRQLRAGQSFAALRSAPAAEPERPEAAERPEQEPREPSEREREGDYEPVSLPQFLKTLGVAAQAAERRGDELPAHVRDTILPRLKGLLADTKVDAAPAKPMTAVAVLARPPAPPPAGGKSRWLGSAVTPQLRRRDSG
jgi:hypothetical protein